MLMNMHPEGTYSDSGTVLDTGEAALVTEGKGTRVALLMPEMKEGESYPIPMLFIAACAFRSTAEPEFIKEMLEWLENNRKLAQ